MFSRFLSPRISPEIPGKSPTKITADIPTKIYLWFLAKAVQTIPGGISSVIAFRTAPNIPGGLSKEIDCILS